MRRCSYDRQNAGGVDKPPFRCNPRLTTHRSRRRPTRPIHTPSQNRTTKSPCTCADIHHASQTRWMHRPAGVQLDLNTAHHTHQPQGQPPICGKSATHLTRVNSLNQNTNELWDSGLPSRARGSHGNERAPPDPCGRESGRVRPGSCGTPRFGGVATPKRAL